VPLSTLNWDLNHRSLPAFGFVSPDLCNDMHSCAVKVGDHWLGTWVPKILKHLGPRGLLFVVFDEGSSTAGCCNPSIHGGHIAAVIAGPGARHGVTLVRHVDHYSILRLIEDAWGFKRLAQAANPTTPSILNWRAG